MADSRATTLSAQTAVAVERALLESSPIQWPPGARAASSSFRASASALQSRWEKSKGYTHSHLAAHGWNVLFVTPFTWREDGARFFAAKNTAENVTVAAHPGVNFFGDPDYAGNPEDEREWNQQWHPDSNIADAARAAIDPAGLRHAVHRSGQVLGRQAGRDLLRSRIGHGHEGGHVEPIEPGDHAHLERAHGALVVVKNEMGRAAHNPASIYNHNRRIVKRAIALARARTTPSSGALRNLLFREAWLGDSFASNARHGTGACGGNKFPSLAGGAARAGRQHRGIPLAAPGAGFALAELSSGQRARPLFRRLCLVRFFRRRGNRCGTESCAAV